MGVAFSFRNHPKREMMINGLADTMNLLMTILSSKNILFDSRYMSEYRIMKRENRMNQYSIEKDDNIMGPKVRNRKRKRGAALSIPWPKPSPYYRAILGGRCIWCAKKEDHCSCECCDCGKSRKECEDPEDDGDICPGFFAHVFHSRVFQKCIARCNMDQFRSEVKKYLKTVFPFEWKRMILEEYNPTQSGKNAAEEIEICVICYTPFVRKPKSPEGFCCACYSDKLIKVSIMQAKVNNRAMILSEN